MSVQKLGPGALVAVVGPSGSGKDTLLRRARAYFSGNPAIVFPRRAITRAAGDDNEDHLPVSSEAFAHLRGNGAFALDWDAHGLRYGIPASIDKDIAAGRVVVVNLSRSVIPLARSRYSNVVAVAIAIDQETMRQRLIARGRETREEIEMRINRMDFSPPEGFDCVIDNTGPLEESAGRLCALIGSRDVLTLAK